LKPRYFYFVNLQDARCSEIVSNQLIANLLENIPVKEFSRWLRFERIVAMGLVCSFYRGMLCIRGTSHGPVSVSVSVCVCLSVCLSQVGVLLKRLNVGSHKQHHTIAQGL